jgi:DNA-binding IclR family transcriptional regulator
MKTIETNEKSQVQVIARAAAILRALEHENAGLSLGQIAQRVDLARSTVQRIIAALEVEKLVIAASPSGKMRLGPTILRLAASVRTDFASLARPFLVALSKELGETVDLSIIKKDQAVFIDQVTGPHRLRTVSVVGDAYPLHCTANGKAYLGQIDDDDAIVDLIGRKYARRTKHTKVTLAELVADLRVTRQSGVAVDLEEHSSGVCATGVALRDPAGNYVAISVPVPSQRFKEEYKTIARRLLETKAMLEKLIISRNL